MQETVLANVTDVHSIIAKYYDAALPPIPKTAMLAAQARVHRETLNAIVNEVNERMQMRAGYDDLTLDLTKLKTWPEGVAVYACDVFGKHLTAKLSNSLKNAGYEVNWKWNSCNTDNPPTISVRWAS